MSIATPTRLAATLLANCAIRADATRCSIWPTPRRRVTVSTGYASTRLLALDCVDVYRSKALRRDVDDVEAHARVGHEKPVNRLGVA
jgi:hypothetical protein